MARVRPFLREDIPAMVALRGKAFRRARHATPEAMARYVERIFFDGPFADPDLPSLVYENDAGRLAGFLGVTRRRMRYRGEPILAAASTQLMVDPETRSLAAAELLRRYLAGPQQFSVADTSNAPSRKLWEAMGGSTALGHSLYWQRPLRPLRDSLTRSTAPVAARLAGRIGGPLVGLIDRMLASRRSGRWSLPVTESPGATLDGPALAALLPAMAAERPLLPAYEPSEAAWLLDCLAERKPAVLRGATVPGPDGKPAGWFLYLSQNGIAGSVITLGAAPGQAGAVYAACFADAWRQGLTRLEGRLDPLWADEVASCQCSITRQGPWTLVHSPRPEILRTALEGRAFISRLDGEWWMDF
jgi:hypothetical protein